MKSHKDFAKFKMCLNRMEVVFGKNLNDFTINAIWAGIKHYPIEYIEKSAEQLMNSETKFPVPTKWIDAIKECYGGKEREFIKEFKELYKAHHQASRN